MWRNFTLVMCNNHVRCSGLALSLTRAACMNHTYERFQRKIQRFRSDFAVDSHCLSGSFLVLFICRAVTEADTKWIQLTLTFVRHDVVCSFFLCRSICICGFYIASLSVFFFVMFFLSLFISWSLVSHSQTESDCI